MTGQEFLEGLIFCAMDFDSRYLPVQKAVKIEGGLMVTLDNGSQWRIDAVKLSDAPVNVIIDSESEGNE